MSQPLTINDLCVVVASNDEETLNRNLMVSPLVRSGVQTHIERNASSAAAAYNRGLDATNTPFVIFAHHDVYFPPGWERKLFSAIGCVDKIDPEWALIAPFGMSASGKAVGDVWSTSLGRRVGRPVQYPEIVQSYDELAFILRRDSGLRFDENLSAWHMYGTDIVQSARKLGKNSWVADLPLVHNDRSKRGRIGSDFDGAYHFIRRKWKKQLPIRTPILWITPLGTSLPLWRLRDWRIRLLYPDPALDPNLDSRHYSALSGWE